jgi:hypothetical protein
MRIIMPLLSRPTTTLLLHSPLTPDEAVQRLSRYVESPTFSLSSLLPSRSLFVGQITNYTFQLSKISEFGKRGSGIQIEGHITPAAAGSEIVITIKPLLGEYLLVFIFTPIIVAIPLLFIYWTITGQVPPTCGLLPAVVLGLAVWIGRAIRSGESADEVNTKAHLRAIFETVPETVPSAPTREP